MLGKHFCKLYLSELPPYELESCKKIFALFNSFCLFGQFKQACSLRRLLKPSCNRWWRRSDKGTFTGFLSLLKMKSSVLLKFVTISISLRYLIWLPKHPSAFLTMSNTVGPVSKNADTCESLEMNNSLIIGNNDTD